jgi:hypothetical protein
MKMLAECPSCRIVLVEDNDRVQMWLPLLRENDKGMLVFDEQEISKAEIAYRVVRHYVVCGKDEANARAVMCEILRQAFADGFQCGDANAHRELAESLKSSKALYS